MNILNSYGYKEFIIVRAVSMASIYHWRSAVLQKHCSPVVYGRTLR